MFEQAKLYEKRDFNRTIDYLNGAIQAFENTIELEPELASAKHNLASSLALRNQLKERQNSSATEDQEKESNKSNSSEKPTPPSDPKDSESGKANDSSSGEPQGTGDPSKAQANKDPTTTDKMAGKPGAQRLGVQEALMLLDSIENDEKRITLSELIDPKTKTATDSNANW